MTHATPRRSMWRCSRSTIVTVSGSESSTTPPGTASGTSTAMTGATMRLIPKPEAALHERAERDDRETDRQLTPRDVHGRESGRRRRRPERENGEATAPDPAYRGR